MIENNMNLCYLLRRALAGLTDLFINRAINCGFRHGAGAKLKYVRLSPDRDLHSTVKSDIQS